MAGRNTVEIILSARDQASDAVREAFGTMNESSNKFVGGLLSAKTLIAGAIATIGGYIAKTGIDYNQMVENSTVAWTTLLGSQEKAKKQIQDIATFAKNTQFDTEGVDAMAKYLNNAGYAGQDLFDQLTRVADVSGAFNITADNAKEMVRQMSQVDQAQVAYTADLDILQNQGIPIFKAIAAELHTNVGAVRKMASEGKISADIYNKAFDSVADSVKGSSAKQAATFTGMMSTLKDDWSILAGQLSKPLFETMEKGLRAFMPIMDALPALAKGDMDSVYASLNGAFGPGVTKTIKDFFQGAKEGFTNGFGPMQTGIGTFGAAVGNTFYTIQTTIKKVIGDIKPALEAVFDIMQGKNIQAVEILTKLGLSGPAIKMILDTLITLKTNIVGYFNDVVNFYTGLFKGKGNIADSFISMFNTVKAIAMPILQDIVKFIGDQFSQIVKFWNQYGGQITQAVQNFFAVLATIFKVLAPVLLFIIQSVWDNIKGVIEGAIKIIQGVILVFTAIFTGNWGLLWTGIKDILSGAVEAIWNIINLMFIGKVLKGVGGFFGLIKELFSGGWSEITSGLRLFVDDVGTWFAKIVDQGKAKFGELIDAAKNIPQGIANGISDGIHWVTDGIMGLANELLKQFKKTLGINSPSKVFYEMGGHILDGLINGLSSGNLLDLGKSVFKDFGGGIMNTVDKIKGFVSGAFGGGSVSGNVTTWLQSAMAATGVPSSWLGPLSTMVQHESGGDPSAINNWDSNAKAGHPSQGLMQLIPSTMAAYAMPGMTNILNPIQNAIAGIRYIQARYGNIFNVPGIKNMMNGGGYVGYAAGTDFAPGGLAMVGENGPELMYVPRGSQIKTNSETNKLLGGSHKTYNVTVNTLTADMNESDLVRALQRMERLNHV
jgi:tape measure domain-containing protein